jgi:hypothetical protein
MGLLMERQISACIKDLTTEPRSRNVFFDACGCSSMVELQLPKLVAWVRFPSPAPKNK